MARVYKSRLSGSVKAPPSKSYSHRILICSAFASSPVRIKGLEFSADVSATAECLSRLGAGIEKCVDGCIVTPVKHTKNAVFDCGESGSTLRFMLPVAAAAGGKYVFEGSGRLPLRPNGPLVSALTEGGVSVEGEGLPLQLKGKLCGGAYKIDCGMSSQYLTGLLLAAPLIGEDVSIEVSGGTASASYVALTTDVMKAFGVEVEVSDNVYFVKGGQKYISPGEIEVEGDWSNAAFFLAAGILSGEVSVYGLNPFSKQGDRAVADIFKRFGGDIKYEKGAFIAKKSALKGIKANLDNAIDLAPIVSVVAAFSDGETVLTGVGRLKIKESDRLSAVCGLLKSFGAAYEVGEDRLVIRGKAASADVKADGLNDHRIVMAAVSAGALCGVSVTCPEAVNKSYPAFFTDYSRIGGVFDVE
ncbi:MAG: 3-phosphoshikimate 1-carboxyvinyltransferase [Clostridia bacterium]|nr:3-phosphoshikimate 1-carboxyvinyltransferase [Clostridia bacterium]